MAFSYLPARPALISYLKMTQTKDISDYRPANKTLNQAYVHND